MVLSARAESNGRIEPMEKQEKSAEALAKQSAQQTSSVESIAQSEKNLQDSNEKKEHKGSKKKRKVLPYYAKVYSFAIKCYDEQLPLGWEETCERIRAIDKKYHILAIKHDKDLITDGIWEVATEKSHYHIIIRCSTSKDRVHVCTILKMLGIEFRKGFDDALWANHGVESVGEFCGYAMYLTHETKDAIADGKEKYEITEIISNLTLEEIKQVREGYNRLIDKSKRVLTEDLEILDKQAFQMGYEMKNFDAWYSSQPFIIRSNSKMRTIRESYEMGVNMRIQENSQMCRLCVFIAGAPNTGKTYAAEQALRGKRILSIGGGGSGKLDELRADHEAIIIDDDICPNLLNMSDNKICRAYRRNRNNPPWAGQYFIVTSNLTFREWVEKCGIRTREDSRFGVLDLDSAHYQALLSRFCIGRVAESGEGYNQLYIEQMSERGSVEVQQERLEMMKEFLAKYNAVIKTYDPKKVKVDVSEVISKPENSHGRMI